MYVMYVYMYTGITLCLFSSPSDPPGAGSSRSSISSCHYLFFIVEAGLFVIIVQLEEPDTPQRFKYTDNK